jgi:hypothetical protein
MSLKSTLHLTSVLLVLAWAGTAHAQYPLTSKPGWGKSAAEAQIGTGLPLPVGTAGIFLGGMTMVNGGTSCGNGPGGCSISPDGPGTAYWPPLLIPALPGATVMQTGGTSKGGAIVAGSGGPVLSAPAAGAPVPIAVFPTNPAVFQVATSISYAWPGVGTVTLAPGGAPGPAVLGTATAGGVITYSGGAKSFGGPGQFAIAAGPGAAGGRVGPNGTGQNPVASVWINFVPGLPNTVMTVGIVGASNPIGLGQAGAPVASPPVTTMFGIVGLTLTTTMNPTNGSTAMVPAASAIGVVNFPAGAGACTMWCVGPLGTIPSSLVIGPGISTPTGTMGVGLFPSNMVTGSKGFPWTTGLITISQPAASPAEIFWLSGADNRITGTGTATGVPLRGRGNISLVSGSLSTRQLSGPNANRGWLSLTMPEPTAALGVVGALAMLGLCHGLVRRRSH